MSNDQVNKQREAAAPFRDGEPDSMDISKDSRPEHSPYASQVCAVYFQGNGPLHIPHALLHQSVELASRNATAGCFSSSSRDLHLNDIDYNTGHVLIHFMATGSDTGPIVKGKASDVDRVMREAEEQAAKRAEETAAKEAEKAAAEAAHEEEEIACLLAKKARRGGRLIKTDRERLSALEHNATKRAEARAAREIAEAKTAHALSAPAADKVDLSEPSFAFPTLDDDYNSVRSSVDRDIPAPDQPHTKNKDESFVEHASSNSPSSNDNDWQYMGISPSSASDGFDLTG
ncbi:hypothetical protein Forpi1262_v014287 [Fusarium oxysporum f. sp. raphani]|uniref:Uncharacterized protein n=1 Tax=Fusarium oxysporum f. sp. raphani TaxID=96318 RepID=A0A8J5PLG7_FUSOX|nr:hypothetical protein Forpi1262_v014287 [Fusarium oxysporum f. sp. raphani]